MAPLTKAPKGTLDVLPNESYKWQFVESTAMQTAKLFGFSEMRVPTFEHTELFTRSVGDTTDVVQKEMYTFLDKKGRSITLRPEGTAGIARATIEHGLLNETMPHRACYTVSCFRYENTQAGRYREFHQFGAEMFGSATPDADAMVISMANEILVALGIDQVRLELNSIGCPECRKVYHQALREYFSKYEDKLCETCRGRLEKNPMRILDCKSEVCSQIAKDAPKILDYICDDCSAHFEGLKKRLDLMHVSYVVNPTIVRGLDYYTRTVFEFVSEQIGAQGTICGGGRYDGLIEELGGPATPALGFAMGLERVLMVMEKCGSELPEPERCDIYIGSIGENASLKAFELAHKLRNEGFIAESDCMGRSVKAQMKYADKIGAKYTVILGDNELETNRATIKNMTSKQLIETSLDDAFVTTFYDCVLNSVYNDLTDSVEKLERGE